MSKYVNAEKLVADIEQKIESIENCPFQSASFGEEKKSEGELIAYKDVISLIASFQQEQPAMIQWTGNNLKEVINFTGKCRWFDDWFKSWEEYENYVHTHNDILKLFCDDGSYYEVPVGAWIIKTPDGYNVPLVARLIHAKQEQPEVDLEKEICEYFEGWRINYYSETVELLTNFGYEVDFDDVKDIARHFYELGLKARK